MPVLFYLKVIYITKYFPKRVGQINFYLDLNLVTQEK